MAHLNSNSSRHTDIIVHGDVGIISAVYYVGDHADGGPAVRGAGL